MTPTTDPDLRAAIARCIRFNVRRLIRASDGKITQDVEDGRRYPYVSDALYENMAEAACVVLDMATAQNYVAENEGAT